MTDWDERAARVRKEAKLRRRNARIADWTAKLVAGVVILTGIVGLITSIALLSAIGIFLGWNLGVYGLAHAVHTEVTHISYWTAFGAGFAIGTLRRLLSGEITFKKT